MKQFIASIYLVIILFIGLNIEVPTQEKNEKQSQIAWQTNSVNNCYLSGYYNGFNHDANIKTSQHLVQRILPSFKEFPYSKLFNEKNAELVRNKNISKCIFKAGFQVIRFEGPDLIHPFNYFW